jgi:hypothetical protein
MYHACVSRLESVRVASGVRVSVIGEGEDTHVGHKSSVEVRSMVVEDLETLGQSVNRPSPIGSESPSKKNPAGQN